MQRRSRVTKLPDSIEPCRVIDSLYIGDHRTASDAAILKRYKITHVLNAAYHLESGHFPTDFTYLVAGLQDSSASALELIAKLPSCIEFIDQAINAKHGAVLVHCYLGVSRSAAVVCGYLMYKYHYTFAKALDLVSCARPSVLPNKGFMQQLEKYETTLNELRTGSQTNTTIPRNQQETTTTTKPIKRTSKFQINVVDVDIAALQINRNAQFYYPQRVRSPPQSSRGFSLSLSTDELTDSSATLTPTPTSALSNSIESSSGTSNLSSTLDDNNSDPDVWSDCSSGSCDVLATDIDSQNRDLTMLTPR